MNWFKPAGPIYRPISLRGWIITLLAFAFCLHVFLFIDGRSHSVSDTVYGIFPYWIPTFLLWVWIATCTSSRRDTDSSR